MRTTLAVDDDVLAAARELAEHSNTSIGSVISELAREGLASRRRALDHSGRVPTFAPRRNAPSITSDAVAVALEEA